MLNILCNFRKSIQAVFYCADTFGKGSKRLLLTLSTFQKNWHCNLSQVSQQNH